MNGATQSVKWGHGNRCQDYYQFNMNQWLGRTPVKLLTLDGFAEVFSKMELDVRLTRSGDEPWGFRLSGGVDYHMPLTVVKVVPDSPADAAGLRNGDTVVHIDGADASRLAHEDSKKVLAAAGSDLRLGVVRGLYDPVLDDYDPIYEPIDQDDFDQSSQPTEVPNDLDLDLTLTLPEFAQGAPNGLFKPLPDLLNGQKPDSRSLTASPFVVPTKPYRPFSTEPLPEIPSLEQPIILNPNFHDEFGRLKDEEEFLPKTRFKLPISEQYDPDGTKQKMKLEALKSKNVITKDFETTTCDTKIVKQDSMVKKDFDMKDHIMTKHEVKFMEQMKKDIDLETIEKTAMSVVDDSIEKAITVAEEIKREIDVELSESSESESVQLKSSKKSSKVTKSTTEASDSTGKAKQETSIMELKDKTVKEVTELVDLIDKTTEEIVKQKEHRIEKTTSHVDKAESTAESTQSEQKICKSKKVVSEEVESNVTHTNEDIKESRSLDVKETQQKISKTEAVSLNESHDTVEKTQSHTTKEIKSETKYSTSKLLSEQRAYTIGLQTIPNIRGTVHSSYHYDLLLKTFFIHLTDVMVALSRFILAEPVLSKPPEQDTKTHLTEKREMHEDTVTKAKETVSFEMQDEIGKEHTVSKSSVQHEDTKHTVVAHKLVPTAKKERVVGKILQKAQEIRKHDTRESVKFTENKESAIYENKHETNIKREDDRISTEEYVKTRELSGLKMAQLTEKKPEELMLNMENVLTEFESKSSNEDIEIVRERRSKSRSAAATPVDMMHHEMSEHMTTSAISSVMSESKTSRTSESGYETTDYETVDGAKTYIAIVQSHVYTNKDAIFEASRRQSTEESIIKESVESVSTEKVAEKSFETSEKAVQAVVDTSTKMVSAVKGDKVEITEKKEEIIKEVFKEVQKAEEIMKHEDMKSVEKVQDVVIQEITEPGSVDIKSTFSQNYIVTEAKEEIETSKSEYSSKHKEKLTVIEEIAAINEEAISFKAETMTDKVGAIKDECITLDKETINLKQESASAISEQKSVVVQKLLEEEIMAVKEKVSAKQEMVKKPVSLRKTYVPPNEKPESAALKISKEQISEKGNTIVDIKQQEDVSFKKVEVKKPVSFRKTYVPPKEKTESAALKISKEQITEKDNMSVEIKQQEDISFKKVEVKKPVSVRKTYVPPKEKTESAAFKISKEQITEKDNTSVEIKQQKDISLKKVEVKKPVSFRKTYVPPKEKTESAALKISKEEISEKDNTIVEVKQQRDVSFKKVSSHLQFDQESTFMAKSVDQESTFVAKSANQESTFVAKSADQESSFIAKSVDLESTSISKTIDEKTASITKTADTRAALKLSLDTDYDKKKIEPLISQEGDLCKTPTPSTVPPTPLTDEYVFKLVTKLPNREGLPDIPRDCTPSDDEDEDPHIVKKGLVPHLEANIEEQKIFDPPLPTPPTTPQSPTSKSLGLKGGAPLSSMSCMSRKKPVYFKPGLRGGAPMFPLFPVSSKTPVYVKPGLRGGADQDLNQEELKEIELKSSLLASAIDETIKSIEEYKEEVGIKQSLTASSTEVKTEETIQNGVMYNGYAKVVETKVFENAAVENSSQHESKNFVEIETVKVNYTNEEQKQNLTNGICENPLGTIKPNIQSHTETTEQVNGLPDVSAVDSTVVIPKEKNPTNENVVDVTANTTTLEVQTEVAPKVEEKKHVIIVEEKRDPMEGYRPVPFDPEELNAQREKRAALGIKIPYLTPSQERELYKTPTGEIIGTHQGIVDGLEESFVDADMAKELGKPGITEEKIAELISGEAEMLREAHVMGLSRVLKSHMHRDGDDSSVDFNKIKPIVESLKDSEVLKALNEELLRDAEERKKKEAKKEAWTTFLQKPKRPVPKSKFGYYKDMDPEEEKVPVYKPKIVKQPKPKVAPDYKPKNFNTGLLPWEERALREPTPPPVEPEEPILIPEEAPEILEAVDPLPESEVPDLEDSGIPLPPPPEPKETTPPPEENTEDQKEELDLEAVIEETEKIVEEKLVEEMEGGNIAEQIMYSVQNMVDPNAPLEQQLAQMRAQLAALAQLPGVIQQSLELVTRQLAMMGQGESAQRTPAIQEMAEADMTPAAVEETEVSEDGITTIEEMPSEPEPQPEAKPEPVEPPAPTLTPEEIEKMRREEQLMMEEQKKLEKQKKELMEQARIEHESRQIKQRPTPRVGNPLPDPRVGSPAPRKPQPVFGPAAPWERPVVLPGGRKWKTPKDAYNDAFIAETLQAQAELIAGKAMGWKYESDLLPYDQRVNFMKYEKPPVSLDHLKDSDVYKMVHNMDLQTQPKRVEMLTPVIAECDYREKCRSMTPCSERRATMQP